MTRVVVDASTLLSAAVARRDGPLTVLLDAAQAGAIEMIACDRLLGEVERGLQRPYFRERIDADAAKAITEMLRSLAVVYPDPKSPPQVVRDPEDDYLVALGRKHGAEFIVTGDRDLLDHDGLAPPAVNARRACKLLRLDER